MLAEILTFKPESPVNSFIRFPYRRVKLLEIENKVSELLTLSDLLPVRVALATYAANYLKQVPLWMMMVAPPSSGKTEILGSMYNLPDTEVVSDLTKSSLLSGTSKKDKVKGATGGLLKKFGDFGFIIFKDMTSLLSKHPDVAAEVFSAFREIYDGDFIRYFGNDGGTHKEWHGRLGVLAAVTSEIEKHRSAFSVMGDRFLTIRVYNNDDLRMVQARTALRSSGKEQQIRAEMQELAGQLFQDFEPDSDLQMKSLSYIHDYITPLTAFVADCRTPVERSSYSRDIQFIHATEGYARLAKQLYGLFCGCIAIGCSLAEAWQTVVRVALDTIPEQRSQILEAIYLREKAAENHYFTLNELRLITRLPQRTNERIASDLYSVKVLDCSFGQGRTENEFWLSDKTREYVDSFTHPPEEPVCIPDNRNDPITTSGNVDYRGHKSVETEDTNIEEIDNAA
ncbi:MAG: hypothetical protein K8R76_05300 [Candidatus Aegiribacteria sp.]|nr:hypothetical protein [Candidatus Aegiribacteria sp.]